MRATAAANAPGVAIVLRWAACIAFVYAALVIVNTAVFQELNHWVQGLTRAACFVVIGAALLRRARWARLVGFGLSIYFLGFSVIDFGRWLAFRTPWLSTNLPHMGAPVTAVATALLATLVILLVHPAGRAADQS